MPCAVNLDKMQGENLRTIDKEALVDMSGFNFDYQLPRNQRARHLLETVKNPYCFRVGEVCVKVDFTDNAPSLQECFSDFLHRKKSGL